MRTTTATMQMASFSGPLPPASFLREYESAFPGTAERILVSFEKEGDHRRAMDLEGAGQSRTVVEGQVFVMKFGAISTAIIASLGLVVAAVLASHGQYPLAAAIGGGEIVGLTLLGLVRKPKTAPPPPP